MRKLFPIAVFALVAAFSASPAVAAGPYVSGNLGVTILNHSTLSDSVSSVDVDYNPKFGATGAIGYDSGRGRVELELGYRTNDVGDAGSGDVNSEDAMVNGYYDFRNQTPWTTFLGAGVGVARVKFHNVKVSGITLDDADNTAFAYQFIAGIGYTVNPHTSIDLSYRYLATANLTVDGVNADYGSHNIMIGARYMF